MTDGERWARRVLEALRAGRYRPRAWGTFLRDSFRRSSDTVHERPRERRDTLLVAAAGVAAWGGVAIADRPILALTGVAWWALVIAMMWWHLGMLERADGSRFAGLGAANLVSVFRAGAIPLLAVFDPRTLAIALIGLGALDILDGRLARRLDQVTRLGHWLDGTTDTIILAVAAITAAALGSLPWWLVALIMVRVALPWLFLTGAYFARAAPPPSAIYVSARLPGAALMLGIVLALLGATTGTAIATVGVVGALTTFAISVTRTRLSAGETRQHPQATRPRI